MREAVKKMSGRFRLTLRDPWDNWNPMHHDNRRRPHPGHGSFRTIAVFHPCM